MSDTSVLSKHFGAWGKDDTPAPGQRRYETVAAQHSGWPPWRELIAGAQAGWAMAEAQDVTPVCTACQSGEMFLHERCDLDPCPRPNPRQCTPGAHHYHVR